MKKEWIILDAMGVLYQSGDDVGELLQPFLRENSCKLTANEISENYLACSLGEMSSSDFWLKAGLDQGDEVVTRKYLSLHCLNPNLKDFLMNAKESGFKLACLSNDVSEWSKILRKSFKLEGYFDEWIISGDVSMRKPDKKIYELALERLSVSGSKCVFVDDRLKNLTEPVALGIDCYLFGETLDGSAENVRSVRNFSELSKVLIN